MGREQKPIDVAAAAARYAEGVPVTTVAAEFGVSRHTIVAKFRRAGVQLRDGGPLELPVATEELERLRAEGLTFKQVGEQVGMSAPGVYSRLRAAGGWRKPKR